MGFALQVAQENKSNVKTSSVPHMDSNFASKKFLESPNIS